MKKIVLLMLLASVPSVQAEKWVYSRDKVLMYDTDSIARKGAFSEMSLSEFGSVRFDCVKSGFLRISSPTAMQEGWREVHKGFPMEEARTAACSKQWEFWKR